MFRKDVHTYKAYLWKKIMFSYSSKYLVMFNPKTYTYIPKWWKENLHSHSRRLVILGNKTWDRINRPRTDIALRRWNYATVKFAICTLGPILLQINNIKIGMGKIQNWIRQIYRRQKTSTCIHVNHPTFVNVLIHVCKRQTDQVSSLLQHTDFRNAICHFI